MHIPSTSALPVGANGVRLRAVQQSHAWLTGTGSASRRAAIYDTDFLLNRTTLIVRSGSSSGTLTPGFASQHVFDELYGPDAYGRRHKWDKLSEQAAAAGNETPAEVFQSAFEEFLLPHLTFVDMGDLFADHPLADRVRKTHNGRGASDVPTAQLAVLLSRVGVVVYSHDIHLRRTGLAPLAERLSEVTSAEEELAHDDRLRVGFGILTIGGVRAVGRVVQAVSTAARISPWIVRGLLAGAAVAALMSPRLRERALERLDPVIESIGEYAERVGVSRATIEAVVVEQETEHAIETRIAEAFVRYVDRSPMLAGELLTAQALREVLNASSCFVEASRWRYSLGQAYEQAANA
jgi:hypothetical protein